MAETPSPILEPDHVSKRFDRTVVAEARALAPRLVILRAD